jgi:UDP-GlcNAc:undecaprenyl-phosphate GlcNAc-1-phosphate transferase
VLVVSFAAAVLLSVVIREPESGSRELLVVLGVAVGLSVVGWVDDLRQLSPTWRLVAEVLAALTVWSIESGVNLTGVMVVDMFLTILWVVGITNAFNLLDNVDGLSSGLAAIACVAFFALAVSNGQFLVAALAIGLAGCTVGFLRNNFYPARIYMGDAGALFIGFLIAYLGIKLRFEGSPRTTALVPVLVCLVAIFDTMLVVIARLGTGRSPFQGGRDHVSHRLIKVGLSIPVAVGAIYFLAAALGVVSFVVSRIDSTSALILVSLVGIAMALVGVLLLMVPVYPESRLSHYFVSRRESTP